MTFTRQDTYLKSLINNYNQDDFYKKINKIPIAIVGCGGIGSPLVELLVRGGFLNLILIDNDIIDKTNLQRQIYLKSDIGELKAVSLKNHLLKINNSANIEIISDLLTESNIDKYLEKSNFIIDATDDFDTRKLINKYSEKTNKSWQYNGAIKTEIMTCIFNGQDKLFDKIFPKSVQNISCCEVGVLASTTFTSASISYQEILKFFLGVYSSTLIKFDIWNFEIHKISLN